MSSKCCWKLARRATSGSGDAIMPAERKKVSKDCEVVDENWGL